MSPPSPSGTEPPADDLRVLALEPYYGGSHRAFLDAWAARSRHRFTILGLPPHKWKWRMRHGAITLADQASELVARGERFDLVFASDMLDLAQWRGLAEPSIRTLPAIAYFHENQLTYPVRVEAERDLHFAFTNITTALAAEEVWWNSAFHRDDFLAAVDRLWTRLPDYRPKESGPKIRSRSRVLPQGIDVGDGDLAAHCARPRSGEGLHLVWAARWEHDKNPEAFFAALEPLVRADLPFRVSVLGERFRQAPEIFERARPMLGDRVVHWGWLDARTDYLRALAEAGVFVSTADHEFFGVAAVEAMALGCRPLLPRRLAYPELLEPLAPEQRSAFLYEDGTLSQRLEALVRQAMIGQSPWPDDKAREAVRSAMEPYRWPRLVCRLDRGVDRVAGRVAGRSRDEAQGSRP